MLDFKYKIKVVLNVNVKHLIQKGRERNCQENSCSKFKTGFSSHIIDIARHIKTYCNHTYWIKLVQYYDKTEKLFFKVRINSS